MGKVLECITDSEEAFIAKQKVFFVATAPLDKDHRVNVSPKAPGASVVVIDPHTVAYSDLSGSGAETAAHVMENGRMTILFCNLESGAPKILRLYGTARFTVKEEVEPSLLRQFPTEITSSFGFRAIFILKVERISTSCGYSLPVMAFEKHRKILEEYTEKAGEEGMKDYCLKKNSFSIDGLPSLALIRNKNTVIVPKHEDGYIHGEVAGANGATAGANGATAGAHVATAGGLKRGRTRSESKIAMLGLGAAVFMAGVVAGAMLIVRYPFLYPRSEAFTEL
jgi:hypothetical protein